MNYIRQLAGQTAVYGLGIVIPRLLNYVLLTPFYTRIFDRAEYGIITEFYAYVVFLIVILTYGMETGFFRFADKYHDKNNVYRSTLIPLAISSFSFIFLTILFSHQISGFIGYKNNPEYVALVAMIVGLDAFTAVPFAKLRLENKAMKYALIRILEVIVNIAANWFFLYYCPRNFYENNFIDKIYIPGYGVGYVFISNLLSSSVKLMLLSYEILVIRGKFEFGLLKRIFIYSFPLLIAGLAGTINEALDRVLLKHLTPEAGNPMEQLGIYGASYKLAVLMTLFVQMFRYASEPFYFSKKDEKDAREIYAVVMKYFIFSGMAIFLLIMLYLDVFILFVGKDFRGGIEIVPIILFANLMMGIFFNLSIWYKITNKTIYGAYIVCIGALITILVNYLFIPVHGFYASAWGHMASYSIMVLVTYLIGQKFFRVPYDLKRILFYIFLAFILYILSRSIEISSLNVKYILNAIFILIYLFVFYLVERKWNIRKINIRINEN